MGCRSWWRSARRLTGVLVVALIWPRMSPREPLLKIHCHSLKVEPGKQGAQHAKLIILGRTASSYLPSPVEPSLPCSPTPVLRPDGLTTQALHASHRVASSREDEEGRARGGPTRHELEPEVAHCTMHHCRNPMLAECPNRKKKIGKGLFAEIFFSIC